MEYLSCGHLLQSARGKPVDVPAHANRQSPDDTPDYPGASQAPASGSRWSFQGAGRQHQNACGTGAPTNHRYDVPSASHVTVRHSPKAYAYDPYHVVLAGYCGAQVCISPYTCRPLKKVSSPHACTVCRRGRYNVPSNRILLARTGQITLHAVSAVGNHCAE